MKITLATEEIEVQIELSESENIMMTKRMSHERAKREFARYLSCKTDNSANCVHYTLPFSSQYIYVVISTDYKSINDYAATTMIIEGLLKMFIYHLYLFGYQPELYQGDPVRVKHDNWAAQKLSDGYLHCESYGHKFIIKKEKINE
jgi:hypothetical protein